LHFLRHLTRNRNGAAALRQRCCESLCYVFWQGTRGRIQSVTVTASEDGSTVTQVEPVELGISEVTGADRCGAVQCLSGAVDKS